MRPVENSITSSGLHSTSAPDFEVPVYEILRPNPFAETPTPAASIPTPQSFAMQLESQANLFSSGAQHLSAFETPQSRRNHERLIQRIADKEAEIKTLREVSLASREDISRAEEHLEEVLAMDDLSSRAYESVVLVLKSLEGVKRRLG